MRRDLQAMERLVGSGIRRQDECPGASARGC